jgi:predicted dehydrogenase
MRLGFIGAGRQAQDHAKCAVACGAEIVTAYTNRPDSPNRAAFAKIAPGVRWATALNEPFRDADAVVCAAPWDKMPGLAVWLLAANKPALIEKPIAFTSAEAARMIGAHDFNHKGKAIGFNRRFYEPVRQLKDRINAGGMVSATVSISNHMDVLIARHGEAIKDHVHPVMSIHSIDLMLHLFGPCVVEKRERPIYLLRSTERAAPIVLSLGENDPMRAGISAVFDDGTAYHLSPLEFLTVYDGVEVVEPTDDMPIRRYVSHETSRTIASTTFKPGLHAQMRAWLDGDYSVLARPTDAFLALDLISSLRV